MPEPGASTSDDGTFRDLLDYRRRTFALYDDVRRLWPEDPEKAHSLWRSTRGELFGRHPQSAIPASERAAFAGLRYFPYRAEYRFSARLVEEPAGERFEIASSTGEAMWLRRVGRVTLPLGTLPVFWIDVYGGGLFLPFRDVTSGRATYGGGRYLLDTVKGADLGSTPSGELVLDLNFAYNPSCHYDPRWSCPLPGPESRLDAAIEAGELA